MTDIEDTAEIPLPPIVRQMEKHPGSLFMVAAEWAGIILMGIGLLTVVFLLCVGGWALVHKAPG